MTAEDTQPEPKKPKNKKPGFWRKYFGFFALVAGISSAGKPWEEEEEDEPAPGEQPPKSTS
jgi:hypothetical protein